MKKIFLTLLFITSLSITAQELKWHTDLSTAVHIANKEKKALMLFFTGSDWCGWCTRLQKEVFYTDEFKKWSNNNVVLVELDYPKRKVLDDKLKQQNDYLQRIFGVQGFPTVWFVKPTLTGDKLDLKQLGSTGYIAGGPTTWLGEANKQMAGKK
jgi:protein disulfide-isomerase